MGLWIIGVAFLAGWRNFFVRQARTTCVAFLPHLRLLCEAPSLCATASHPLSLCLSKHLKTRAFSSTAPRTTHARTSHPHRKHHHNHHSEHHVAEQVRALGAAAQHLQPVRIACVERAWRAIGFSLLTSCSCIPYMSEDTGRKILLLLAAAPQARSLRFPR